MKTAPNPLTVARVCAPGTTKCTSVTFERTGVNRRCGLKVAKRDEERGSSSSNSTGAIPWLALTRTPRPGVENSAPRPRNWSSGRLAGAARSSGTASQLISRRPEACEPGVVPLLTPPRSAR